MHVATITIDHTKVAADLTDFPIYVNLANLPASFWDVVANGGGDIRVFKSDGTTELPREVVSCDTATDTGELHIKFSGTLSSSVDTEIQIHADGTSSDYAASATYGSQNVWKSGYKFVSHDGGVTDSTANGNNFTNVGTDIIAGVIGNGRDWVQANGDKLTRASAMSGFSATISEFNWSMWARPDFGTDAYFRALASGGQLIGIHFPYSNDTCYWDWGFNGAVRITASASTWYDTWAYYNFVATTAGTKIYRNASQVATGASTTTVPNGSITGWNIAENGGVNWDGSVDEMRMYEGVLGESWQTTEYNNQNSPSTFYTASAVSSGNVTVTPSTQAAAFSIPAYTPSAATKISAPTQSVTASIPSYVVSLGTTIMAATQAIVASIPTYTISIADTIISAATQALTFSVVTYTTVARSVVTVIANTLSATVSVIQPTISTICCVTITAATQVLTFTVATIHKIGGVWSRLPRSNNGSGFTRSGRATSGSDWTRQSRNSD